MLYRPEINGLRAIAVLSVILFHAGFDIFSGGYLGVDIFFVISGYLITTIILLDLKADKFSIITFFDRRIRRLMPALFVMLLVTIPMAWMWLSPVELKDFAVSLITSVTSSSNILFWLESGYFGAVLEETPLVHTWSLAVEQQFYIVFPFLMILFWRFCRNSITVLLLLLFVVSLSTAQWAVYAYPNAAFYLLPTRFWQILLGSFCAIWLLKKDDRISNGSDWLAISGLILIFISIFTFDEGSRVPGITALLPTLGTALVILFASNNNFTTKLLSQKHLVGVGLISYSLYLWHQPIFVFFRKLEIGELTESVAFLTAITLCFVIAGLSWRYIERPWRNKNVFSTKAIYSFNTAFIIFISMVGLYAEKRDGFPADHNSVEIAVQKVDTVVSETHVIGDSHAGHLVHGLAALLPQVPNEGHSGGCIPFYDVDRYDFRFKPRDCSNKIQEYLDSALASEAEKNIILSTMGPVYLDGTSFRGKGKNRVKGLVVTNYKHPNIKDHWKVFELGMRDTLNKLSKHDGKNVVFVIDVPELGIDFGCQATNKRLEIFGLEIGDLIPKPNPLDCKIPRSEFDARAAKYQDFIKEILKDYPLVKLLDPTDLFCDDAWCYGYNDQFGYLYQDVDHLSSNGSIMVGMELIKLLD